jgi:hypothetical protein
MPVDGDLAAPLTDDLLPVNILHIRWRAVVVACQP